MTELTNEQWSQLWKRVIELDRDEREHEERKRLAVAVALYEMINGKPAAGNPTINPAADEWGETTTLEWAELEAGFGNVEPLRWLDPVYANRFQQLLSRMKGKKGNRFNHPLLDRDSKIEIACKFLPLIKKALFELTGSKNYSARAVAVKMFNVKLDDIEKHIGATAKRQRKKKRPA